MSRAGSLKLLATTGVKRRLAAISGLVLVAGALLAPGAAPFPYRHSRNARRPSSKIKSGRWLHPRRSPEWTR